MGRLTRRISGVSLVLAALCLGGIAQAQLTIGSFDGSRSNRPLLSSDYSNLRDRLSNPANFGPGGIVTETVAFAPEITTITPASLSGTDLFFLTEVSALSGAEVTALRDFVLAGNCLVLVTDSGAAPGNSVDQMLSAFDGGSASGFGGGGPGSIVGSGASTNGPFGVLGGADNFASTPGTPMTPGSQTTVIGTSGGANLLMEIHAGALGSGSGGVLAASDVLFMNFFIPPASLENNENNAKLILNFVAGCATPVGPAAVPEPSGLALLGASGFSMLGLYWRRRRAA